MLKADVSVNIYAFLKAQRTGKPVELCCAIGDETIDGKPYEEIVAIARAYITFKGGFEKFAEWGVVLGGNMKLNTIYNEDGLEGMKRIPDKSVDMILCDLPYGTTACKWDTIIPFEPLWEQYERVIKDNGAIVLTASQPFTTKLINSNISLFRYEWIWEKSRPSNFFFAKKGAMKYHENVLVFYKKLPTYNPIMIKGQKAHDSRGGISKNNITGTSNVRKPNTSNLKYPSSIIKVKSTDSTRNLHPTQKPVPLFEYLIKTYTNEGETVLDNCIGSGTTAIACINTNRNYIGFELDKHYCDIANERIRKAIAEKAVGE